MTPFLHCTHTAPDPFCSTYRARLRKQCPTGAYLCRAENPRPSIASISTASWSLTSSQLATSQQGAAATYAVVLKDGNGPSEVKQICSYAYANLGIACRTTLQHTVNGFTVQVALGHGSSTHNPPRNNLEAVHDVLP